MYDLGVDLGDSSVKAAVVRADGTLALASTGEQSLSAPTVAGVGGSRILVGDAAVAACRDHPECRREALVRGLGAAPDDGALAELVDDAVATATARQGGPPDRIVLTCPASAPAVRRRWTEELAARWQSGPGAPRVRVVDESVAVAAYATTYFPVLARDRVLVVADLGGGSCEATVLRGGPDGFEVVAVEGAPFGGLDLDETLVRHVESRLGGRSSDEARLRLDCRAARVRLSEIPATAVRVSVPDGIAEVGLSREGLESMADPVLRASLDAVRRALATVEASPPVLLIGGLTRMPLVARRVAAEIGRPVFAEPDDVEHAVALGAALSCRELARSRANGEFAASCATNSPFVPEGSAAPVGPAGSTGSAGSARTDPEPARATTPPLPEPGGFERRRPRRRIPLWGVVAACALVAAVVAVVGLTVGGSRDPAPVAAAPASDVPASPAAPPAVGPPPAGFAASSPTPTLGSSRVPLGRPTATLVSPNGRVLYVAVETRRELVVIDTATTQVLGTVGLPLEPRYLAVAPDGSRVYVSMSDDAGTRSAVGAVDPVAYRLLGATPTASRSMALAASPDGRVVWVPEHEGRRVTLLDTRNGGTLRSISVGASPDAVALSRDGTRAYVTLEDTAELLELDATTGAEISRVRTGRGPYVLALHPTRPLAVISNRGAASVTIVDTLANQALATVPTGRAPLGVSWSPDGRFAYVADSGDGTVSVVDATSLRVTASVRVPPDPAGIAVLPDGTRGYVTSPGSDVMVGLELGGR